MGFFLTYGVVSTTSAPAHFHPGHPMVHTTRLHRYDHRGVGSMIETEAEWRRIAKQPSLAAESSTSGFVQLSPAQTTVLKNSQRDYIEARQRQQQQAEVRRHRWALLDASRQYDSKQKTIDEQHPVVTRLSSLMSQYVGPIGVGTKMPCTNCPPQEQSKVWVVYDTGSTNIWIASDLCKSGPCTMEGRHRYDHTDSLTYMNPADQLSLDVHFGTGELKGPHGIDHFRVGPFTVPNQTFALIEEQTGQVFHDVPFEGILGLAFPSMSANHVKPFFDTVIDSKALEHNEFAFYFQKGDNAGLRAGNALFWGGVDKAFYDGKIEYFPVTDPYYWAVGLHSFQVGDKVLLGDQGVEASVEHVNGSSFGEGFKASYGTRTQQRKHMRGGGSRGAAQTMPKAIVDTGTTYFTACHELYGQITELLPTARCADINAESHPPITYKLQNAAGTVSAFKFTYKEYMTKSGEGDDAQCHLAFMPIDVPEQHGPGMVLGEVFMRMLYTVFDRGDGKGSSAKVGFATAKHGEDAIKRLADLTGNQADFSAASSSS
jgi:pepsin A